MIRNLKITMAAAMALAAFGVFSASGAQGAEFHCTPAAGQTGCTLTAEPDGTGKTAHHVFEITNKNGESTSMTCGSLTAHATLPGTAKAVTTTSAGYTGCTWNGTVAEIRMNSCNFEFNANGTLKIICPAGKELEVVVPTCTAKVSSQESPGLGYHAVSEVKPRTGTITIAVTVNLTSLIGSNCGINLEGPYIGHFTTGNTIIKAEEDPGSKEVDTWWT